LCNESDASVVITDPVGKGDDEAAEGEVGRLLPITLGGLEIYTDLSRSRRSRTSSVRPRSTASRGPISSPPPARTAMGRPI